MDYSKGGGGAKGMLAPLSNILGGGGGWPPCPPPPLPTPMVVVHVAAVENGWLFFG